MHLDANQQGAEDIEQVVDHVDRPANEGQRMDDYIGPNHMMSNKLVAMYGQYSRRSVATSGVAASISGNMQTPRSTLMRSFDVDHRATEFAPRLQAQARAGRGGGILIS